MRAAEARTRVQIMLGTGPETGMGGRRSTDSKNRALFRGRVDIVHSGGRGHPVLVNFVGSGGP